MGLWRHFGRIIAGALVMLAPSMLAAEPQPKEEPSPRPVEPLPRRMGIELLKGIRTLSDLQQRSALGQREALRQQPSRALEVSKELAAAGPGVWAIAHNRFELIKFVLSGGSVSILDKLLKSKAFPEVEMPLALGAQAYAYGDRKSAADNLSKVDHRGLGASLAGHVALVRALLASDSNKEAAFALADEARLLSPGTLVEEAALRLTIEQAIALGDQKRFERASIRFLWRFPLSLYAGSVVTRIGRVVAASSKLQTEGGREWLLMLGAMMPPEQKRSFYGQVAELALRSGLLPIAEYVAQMATESGDASLNPSRADLMALKGASMLLGPRRADSIRLLDEASAANPSPEYAKLIGAARSLATMIVAPPASPVQDNLPAGASGQGPRSGTPPAPNSAGSVARDALVKKAQASLTNVDKILEKSPQ